MSDNEMDGLEFEHRTTTNTFNERLLRAKENEANEQLNNPINFNDIFESEDTEELRTQLKTLQKQLKRMETKVERMEEQLVERKARRELEASITNMSPEERADYVKQQAEKTEELPNLDVIFEYLLLLQSAPPDDMNDFSATDLIKPHAGIREKAMENKLIVRQEKYSSVHFTKANNVLEINKDAEGEIRHCELGGTCYNNEFEIKFDVLEPSMVMTNLEYTLGIEILIDIGDVLEKIKQESNLLGFFRVMSHYGLLLKDRQEIFDRLIERFTNTSVTIELLSPSKMMLMGTTEAYLILEWQTATIVTGRYRLNADVTDHVRPVLSLEIYNLGSGHEEVASQMNEKFLKLVELMGVYEATETIANKIFNP